MEWSRLCYTVFIYIYIYIVSYGHRRRNPNPNHRDNNALRRGLSVLLHTFDMGETSRIFFCPKYHSNQYDIPRIIFGATITIHNANRYTYVPYVLLGTIYIYIYDSDTIYIDMHKYIPYTHVYYDNRPVMLYANERPNSMLLRAETLAAHLLQRTTTAVEVTLLCLLKPNRI